MEDRRNHRQQLEAEYSALEEEYEDCGDRAERKRCFARMSEIEHELANGDRGASR